MNRGCVYLVGAGCGSADLITLRGARLLERCDAVVYDDLIDPALPDLAPAGAERIYMGKRCGKHSAPQAEISAKLAELAGAGRTVVRLKGGDPFVFGRGGEEMEALRQAGVPCEEVPGISSAIAIPAAAGIPVTHRGVSRSFHVVTGHTADTEDGLPPRLEELARGEGTLIFLMGLGRLARIADELIKGGRAPDTPAAVLSGGNSPHSAAVRGTLADIGEKAAGVRPPAVIVVGETAALELTSTIRRPLEGVRVGVVGTRAVADKLTGTLGILGARTSWVVRPEVEDLPVEWDLHTLGERPRWVVLTSVNGVDRFFRALDRERVDLRSLRNCRFAVIGGATGAALARRGLYPDLCPRTYTSRALALALRERARPEEEILLFRSAQGTPVLPRLLEEAGLKVRDLPAYRTLPGPETGELPPLDYLTFASAGGVELFCKRYGAPSQGTRCLAIGEVTAAALEKRTGGPVLVAREISVEGMVRTILEDWQGERA